MYVISLLTGEISLLTGDTSKRFVSAGRYEVSRRSASGLPTWKVEPVTPHQYVPTIVPYDIHTSFVVPAFLLEKTYGILQFFPSIYPQYPCIFHTKTITFIHFQWISPLFHGKAAEKPHLGVLLGSCR